MNLKIISMHPLAMRPLAMPPLAMPPLLRETYRSYKCTHTHFKHILIYMFTFVIEKIICHCYVSVGFSISIVDPSK